MVKSKLVFQKGKGIILIEIVKEGRCEGGRSEMRHIPKENERGTTNSFVGGDQRVKKHEIQRKR